jgi:hypothetical protein
LNVTHEQDTQVDATLNFSEGFTVKRLEHKPDPELWRYMRGLAQQILDDKGELANDPLRGPITGYAWSSEGLGYTLSLEKAVSTTTDQNAKYWLEFARFEHPDRKGTYSFSDQKDYMTKMGEALRLDASGDTNREQELHEIQLKTFLESAYGDNNGEA